MTRYLFYPAADKRQDEIWQYSCELWGEQQAEIYLRGLHKHLGTLAADKKEWRRLPEFAGNPLGAEGYTYFSRYKHHIIFFRSLSSAMIGIMSILHEAMDIPSRLQEDLRRLESHDRH